MTPTTATRLARSKRHAKHDTRLRTGVIAAVLIVLGVFFSVTKSLPFLSGGGRTVTAEFSEPNQVTTKTPVRIDGITVGHVQSVALARGGRDGLVRMDITRDGLALRADASAAVKFRTLLGGNMEIDLNPGSPSAPPLTGLIPLSHTTVQTEMDDILRIFAGHTPAALRTDLKGLSQGLSGTAAGRLLDALGPSLSSVPAGLSALEGQRPDDLPALIQAAGRTIRALSLDQTALESLISNADTTFRATADADHGLALTLQRAPAAEDSTVSVAGAIDATLPDLNRLSAALLPGVRQLEPAASAATPAATELDSVLRQAQPLVASLRPAVSALASAATPGRQVVDGLAPTIKRLNSSIIPWLASPDSDLHMPVYQLIGPTMATLASAASEYDSFGQFLHFPAAPGTTSVAFIPCTVFVTDPTQTELLRCESLNQLVANLFAGKL